MNRTLEEIEADSGTPTPVSSTAMSPSNATIEELESSLYDFIINERWSTAISFIKHNRGHLSSERQGVEFEDEIDLITNVYCKKLVQERPGKFDIENDIYRIEL